VVIGGGGIFDLLKMENEISKMKDLGDYFSFSMK
jgi:hypothetical protein